MTAVDVDALAKLREAALTIRKEYPSFPVLEQDGTDVIAVWSDGASCPVVEECDEDMAALIVAAVNALPDLLAAVRERDALREAVNGLAAKYDQPAEPGPWPEGTRSLYGGGQVAYDLLAALAATDGTP